MLWRLTVDEELSFFLDAERLLHLRRLVGHFELVHEMCLRLTVLTMLDELVLGFTTKSSGLYLAMSTCLGVVAVPLKLVLHLLQ